MRKTGLVLAGALAIATMGGAAHAGTTVGTANTENCYPFSCFASDGGMEYQQVYSASAFSGAQKINSISFNVASGDGAIDAATYNISFYQTNSAVGALSTNFSSNEGTLLGNFGTFTTNGTSPGTLTFSGTAFNYNPAAGNLLMDVTASNLTSASGYQTSFQADYSGQTMSRAFSSSQYTGADDIGVVTTFGTSGAVSAAPEPATWAMMILGLGLVGGVMYRQHRKSEESFTSQVRALAAA